MTRERAGFTLTELLVTLLLLMLIMGMVLAMTVSTTVLYRADQGRMGANRTSRSSLDIIGNDVRAAGERLNSDISALIVSNDVNGNSTLSIRRGLTANVLPLCSPSGVTAAVNGNNTYRVIYADGSTNLPLSCTTNMNEITDYSTQLALGNTDAYVYDAVAGTGSWAKLAAVVSTPATQQQSLGFSTAAPGYDPRRLSSTAAYKDMRIYLLEERKYSLVGSNLTLGKNNQAGVIASPNITKFTVVPYLKGSPPTLAAMPFPSGLTAGRAVNWKDLAYMDITMTVTENHGGKSATRTVVERYTPRNTQSAQ